MTHDGLLALLNSKSDSDEVHALRAVVELHKPDPENPRYCQAENEWVSWNEYPCETIQAIEKELTNG